MNELGDGDRRAFFQETDVSSAACLCRRTQLPKSSLRRFSGGRNQWISPRRLFRVQTAIPISCSRLASRSSMPSVGSRMSRSAARIVGTTDGRRARALRKIAKWSQLFAMTVGQKPRCHSRRSTASLSIARNATSCIAARFPRQPDREHLRLPTALPRMSRFVEQTCEACP